MPSSDFYFKDVSYFELTWQQTWSRLDSKHYLAQFVVNPSTLKQLFHFNTEQNYITVITMKKKTLFKIQKSTLLYVDSSVITKHDLLEESM